MRHAAIHVEVLAVEVDGVGGEFNLVAKLVVVIERRERIFAGKQALLKSRFEGAVFFGLEVGIRIGGEYSRDAEGFLEAGFLDAGGIAESKASA